MLLLQIPFCKMCASEPFKQLNLINKKYDNIKKLLEILADCMI